MQLLEKLVPGFFFFDGCRARDVVVWESFEGRTVCLPSGVEWKSREGDGGRWFPRGEKEVGNLRGEARVSRTGTLISQNYHHLGTPWPMR